MNASDIAAINFPIARKGFDPDAVRSYLVGLRASSASASSPGAIDAAARAEAEQIQAEARAEAARIIAEAELHAETLREEAERHRADQETLAGERIDEAEQCMIEAEARAARTLEDADRLARERASTILESTRIRLQRLLDAEREVHIRLAAAFSSVAAPAHLSLERDDEEVLDLAFAEFFSSDIEHDASRAWILSDHAG